MRHFKDLPARWCPFPKSWGLWRMQGKFAQVWLSIMPKKKILESHFKPGMRFASFWTHWARNARRLGFKVFYWFFLTDFFKVFYSPGQASALTFGSHVSFNKMRASQNIQILWRLRPLLFSLFELQVQTPFWILQRVTHQLLSNHIQKFKNSKDTSLNHPE